MAIVSNLATGDPVDKSFCTWNRSNAGDPNGALTPQYVGEIVLDTTNKKLWKAESTLNSGWTTLTTLMT